MKVMFRSTVKILLLIAVCSLMLSYPALSQVVDDKKNKQPYYFNINEVSANEIIEIKDDLLSFQYYDKYGRNDWLPLVIYNWEMKKVSNLRVGKIYGQNYFNIDLSKEFSVEHGLMYHIEIKDELGKSYKASFRPVVTEKMNIAADIVVNPIAFKCGDPLNNSIEFYGSFSGGRTPYSIIWYVMNDARTEFLYQPVSDIVNDPKIGSQIIVDQMADYFVMLYVIDACGNEQEKMVQLTCNTKEENVHTLFVEPLKKNQVDKLQEN